MITLWHLLDEMYQKVPCTGLQFPWIAIKSTQKTNREGWELKVIKGFSSTEGNTSMDTITQWSNYCSSSCQTEFKHEPRKKNRKYISECDFFFLFTYCIKVIYKSSGQLDLHILPADNKLNTFPLPSKIIINPVSLNLSMKHISNYQKKKKKSIQVFKLGKNISFYITKASWPAIQQWRQNIN